VSGSVTRSLPSTEEEIWRYSRIDELDLGRFVAAALETVVSDDRATRGGSAPTPLVASPDVFAEINADDPALVSVRVARGTVWPEPIIVTHRVATDGSLATPRLVIEAGEDSEVTVVERFVSADGVTALVLPVLEVRASPAARVTYLAVNELGRGTWQVGHQTAVGERDSSTRLFSVALGGDYARTRAEVRLVGKGARAEQTALYFADGSQMHDFRTIQVHDAPRTTSDLLFKGAVKDTARSVYTGLIKITERGTQTEAFQTNRTLTLSRGAWAESVPNLEIETNDVKCSHASTVGPIDEEQRFYLESRGIPPETAERLVVFGFFDEVLSRMPRTPFTDGVRGAVATKLGDLR
jgi:Fe-S cluster assembly protein SufD